MAAGLRRAPGGVGSDGSSKGGVDVCNDVYDLIDQETTPTRHTHPHLEVGAPLGSSGMST